MSDSSEFPAGAETSPGVRPSSEPVLPPVEPPSAGFIVQLFVVPALIVAAVIGVYLLFGRLASTEADWRELVVDLRSSNPHTRWRGADGLAKLLKADSLRTAPAGLRSPEGTTSEGAPLPLARDPALATELATTLKEELRRLDGSEEHQRLVEYLIKALGWMDVPDVVIPALLQVPGSAQQPWLRQQALIAIGMIAGRAFEQGTPLEDSRLLQQLLDLTGGEGGLPRHLATYILGFLPDEAAQDRLRMLLSDTDRMTRVNAAVGMARSGSLDSLPVFEAILTDAAQQPFQPADVHTDDQANAYFERTQPVLNALTYLSQSAAQFSADDRRRLRAAAQPLADVADHRIKHQAIEALHHLDSAAPR